MDALVPVFVAVLLAETGGKMQGLAHGMALAGASAGRIVGLIALIGLLLFGAYGVAGVALAGMMPTLGKQLFFALALLAAGVPMLWSKPAETVAGHTQWSAVPRLAFQMVSDAGPFIVLAASARTGSPALAAGAALAAALVQALVPVLLGKDWPGAFPVRWVRLGAGLLLTLTGLWQALSAL
jgi:putative Ca2+/H+ antiporter (TMEM165/GDT1 family)